MTRCGPVTERDAGPLTSNALMRTAADVVPHIRQVLTAAEVIAGKRRYLSAYQILERLPNRDAIVASFPAYGLEAFHQAAALITTAVMSHLSDEITMDIANGAEVGFRVGSTTIGRTGPTVVFGLCEKSSAAVEDRF